MKQANVVRKMALVLIVLLNAELPQTFDLLKKKHTHTISAKHNKTSYTCTLEAERNWKVSAKK